MSIGPPVTMDQPLFDMVDPGGIASGDLGLLLLGAVGQDLAEDLPAAGEGGLLVGVVGTPLEESAPRHAA